MARNRKNQSASRFALTAQVLLFCVLLACAGLGFVWYKNQIALLGQQIKEREVRLAELQRQNKMSRAQLDALCSPIALDARVKKLNLGLIAPPVSQIVRLVETPLEIPEAAGAPRDFRQAQATPRYRGN